MIIRQRLYSELCIWTKHVFLYNITGDNLWMYLMYFELTFIHKFNVNA